MKWEGGWRRLFCHLLSFATVKKLAGKTGHVCLHPPKWWKIDFVGNKFQKIQQKVNKSRPETVSHAQLWNSTPYVMSQMAPILSRSAVGFGFCPHQSPTKACCYFVVVFFLGCKTLWQENTDKVGIRHVWLLQHSLEWGTDGKMKIGTLTSLCCHSLPSLT